MALPIADPDLLRNIRVNKACLSQQALAERAGVTKATITSLEAGRHVATLQTMRRISSVLGVEPSAVIEFRRALEQASGLPLQRSYMRPAPVDPYAAHLPAEPYTPQRF